MHKETTMPVKRISDDVWNRLKRWAVPLDEYLDDVLVKLLTMADDHLKCPGITQPSMAERPGFLRPDDINQDEVDSTIDSARQRPAEIPPSAGRLPPGIRLPMLEYYLPILKTLDEMGGKASRARVLPELEAKLRDRLPPEDYQRMPAGKEIRWRNRAQFAAGHLKKKGLLKAEAEWGLWELTEAGLKAARNGRLSEA
jgi:hypothetical protein